MSRAPWKSALVVLLVLSSAPRSAEAVNFSCGGNGTIGDYWWTASGQITQPNNCHGPNGSRCYPAENPAWSLAKASPTCDPVLGGCDVLVHATATLPGLRDMVQEDGLGSALTPWVDWYHCLGAACGPVVSCGIPPSQALINFDNLDTWMVKTLSCAQAQAFDVSVKIRVCANAGSPCEHATVINIPAGDLATALGCPPPPLPAVCGEAASASSGAAGLACPLCASAGGGEGGCSVPVAGGGPSCEPAALGKAQLRYAAGGVGADGYPGSTGTIPWRTALGRHWVHDYAERIVPDPDSTHVWLLTKNGSYREFSNLAAGSGLVAYQTRAPSDEFRKLYFDTATNGWELHTLDGRKDVFRSDGLWLRTILAADPGHPTKATYSGSQLTTVDFPDGRSDTFLYHPGGKLASITENPVSGTGTPARTWIFTWTGDDLTSATRPDGTSWEFVYDATRPGYLTRMDLVSGAVRRVVAAFEYQAGTNNVAKSWRGDPSFTGPNAVDKVAYTYTNPTLPTQTVVTKTVSATFDQATTYVIGRDTASRKPRLTSMQGTCPTCGLSPLTSYAYTGTNPLLPSSMTDARNTRTDYTYTADGRLETKTEAANVPLLIRLTTYTYGDPNFPGLVTRVEVPSTSGGTNKRRTDSAYHATTGLLQTRTIDGFEAGVALPAGFKTTTYIYNGSGQPATIDPPGFGAADATTFTYNLTGRNGYVADTRIDPLVGTTTFGYDGLNRRTSVTDPNNVQTTTAYDSLSRVTEVRRKGAVPSDDLVTTSTYNAFGDLFCTKLPKGNGVEYVYDEAGRLKQMIRGTAVATPTSTTCLDTAQPRERTIWLLDGAGNRTEESLERWTGAAWVSESKTTFTYTCHLDKVTKGAGSAAPSVTEYCYDLNDNLVFVWDPNHPKATNANPTQLYTFDALNRMTSVTAGSGTPNAATTEYGYDVQDHLTSVKDAEGNLTTYTFSDRDLMTQQVSPVSGTTTYTYNEHGELATETDARSIVMTRTTDALDRVTAVTYPTATLNSTYTYDLGAFGKGRLSSLTRNGETVAYTYDRFGRTLQDGALTYTWDKNGNRATITYPGAVTATSTHDFADREATLTAQVGANPPQTLVSAAGYKPAGPLASLTLGNGVTETRAYDARYAPAEIKVDGTGTLLRWQYTTDPVGNITAITDLLNAANNRTYVYQDPQYFLTTGNGPWGTRSWTHDRIGNRLTETKGSVTDTYTYGANGTGGHTPKIATITRGGSTFTYAYDAVGNVVTDGTQPFFYADDRRMSQVGQGGAGSATTLAYDGRGFLNESVLEPPGALHTDDTRPTYGSEGLLYHRFARKSLQPYALANPVRDSDLHVFYFAGRPVATLETVTTTNRLGVPTTTATWQYLTTDHLGTPIHATNTAGAEVWEGGFEPYGADYSTAPTPLRLPGQWFDATWNSGKDVGLYYNVHRWYGAGVGRYGQVDPLGEPGLTSSYLYVAARPISTVDPLGLYSVTSFGSEHFSTGSPKFKPDRVDLDFACSCCSPGGQGWCLKFNVQLTYRFFFSLNPRQCSRAHENVHLRIFKTWVTRSGMAILLPAEKTTYGSEAACKSAGSTMKGLFLEDLANREGEHNREQRMHDARVWVPEFFTCGIFGD